MTKINWKKIIETLISRKFLIIVEFKKNYLESSCSKHMNTLYFYKNTLKIWIGEKKQNIVKRIFWKFFSNGKYIGEIKNGLPHGLGKLYYAHGGEYDGNWKDGERHGLGSYSYSDGRRSFGMYLRGKKFGKMTITCPNGDTYEGTFKNGNPSGKFVFTNTLGIKSEINFKRFKNPLKS